MPLPIGELLLKLGYINKTQLKKALAKQSEEKIIYNRSVQLGKLLIDMEIVSVDDIAEALTEQSKKNINKDKEKEMPR